MMKHYYSFVILIAFTLLSVISCQKNPDGTPDTPDIPGEMHPVPTEGVVDLGLSVLWLDRNVGAVKPTDFGSFFQWAGTLDVTNLDIYLYWNNCPYHTNDTEYEKGWLKYCTVESYGKVDATFLRSACPPRHRSKERRKIENIINQLNSIVL